MVYTCALGATLLLEGLKLAPPDDIPPPQSLPTAQEAEVDMQCTDDTDDLSVEFNGNKKQAFL